MGIIEKIQKKPPHEKIRIIWIVTGIVTVLLIILWVTTSKMGRKGPLDPDVKRAAESIKRGFNDTRSNLSQ